MTLILYNGILFLSNWGEKQMHRDYGQARETHAFSPLMLLLRERLEWA
jgi:hypothetical protein